MAIQACPERNRRCELAASSSAGAEADTDCQFRPGNNAQGAPPKLLLLGWDSASRAVLPVGREGCSLSRIGCETDCLFLPVIRCPAISSPARWSAGWLLRSWSSLGTAQDVSRRTG